MQLLYSAFSYIMSLSVTASFTVLFLLVIRLFLDRVPFYLADPCRAFAVPGFYFLARKSL